MAGVFSRAPALLVRAQSTGRCLSLPAPSKRSPTPWRQRRFRSDLLKLQAEQGYLQKVTAGELQLYLYNSDSASIIEMIGTPSIATARTLTCVPGTFTSELSFYKN